VGARIAGALEIESGINDAPVYLLVVLLAVGEPFAWWTPLLIAYELAAGAAFGLLIGGAGGGVGRRSAVPAAGLVPLGPGPRDVRAGVRRGPAGARVRPAGHLRRRPDAGQRAAAAPRRHPVLRRRLGLAGPDRAVRLARAVRVTVGVARRGAAGADRRYGRGG